MRFLVRGRGLKFVEIPLVQIPQRKTLVVGKPEGRKPQLFRELSDARYEARQLAMWNPGIVFHYHQMRPGGKFQIEIAGLLPARPATRA